MSKYNYLHVLQANYDCGHGWEDVVSSQDREEVKIDLTAYLINAPEYSYKIVKRRELNK